MVAEKTVAEGLLTRIYRHRPQPVGVWHVVGFDDVNLGNIGDPRRRDHVRHSVEVHEASVDGGFKDRGRRIE